MKAAFYKLGLVYMQSKMCPSFCQIPGTHFTSTIFWTISWIPVVTDMLSVFSLELTLPIFQVLMCCSSTSSCSSLHALSFSMSILQSAGCWFRRSTKGFIKQSTETTYAFFLLTRITCCSYAVTSTDNKICISSVNSLQGQTTLTQNILFCLGASPP